MVHLDCQLGWIWSHLGWHTSTVGSKPGSGCDSAHSLPFANILASGQSPESFAGDLYSNGKQTLCFLRQMTLYEVLLPTALALWILTWASISSPFIHW